MDIKSGKTKNQFLNLNQVIDYFAKQTPDATAMHQHEDDKKFSYKQFADYIDLFALRLLDAGLEKGDVVATQLVLIPEHVILMYACFRIGVIIAPLDLRLKPDEVVRDVNKIQPKMFFFLGNTPVVDFRKVGVAVRAGCKSVEHLIQFSPPSETDQVIDGAIGISTFLAKSRLIFLKTKNLLTKHLEKACLQIEARTAALIIYTTGTTGAPKPALLCHENILVQNEILSRGIGELDNKLTTMVNLPPSHVGCVTETLMTTFYRGGKAILLKIFDVGQTLEAIQRHKINLLGQIPTQYRMLWAHADYDEYDLSSLEMVIYAGSAGDLPFLKRLSEMAPNIGTGLGMTENAGFATFSRAGAKPESLVGQVGSSFPELARVTIRQPMREDGSSGDELESGESGEICYHPPIVFLGYYLQPEATKRAVSTDGILYTGDLGFFRMIDGMPADVEEHLVNLEGVDQVEVVGVKHQLFDEGIFAFVKLSGNSDVGVDSMHAHYKNIASYKRPVHIEIWPADTPFPLTRSAKVDKLALQDIAKTRVQELKKMGAWDA